jgi:cytochrome c-type biogenesis protein CcmH/NrfG
MTIGIGKSRSLLPFFVFLLDFYSLAAQSNSPDSISQHTQKVEQALRASDRAGAEREYRQIVTLDPENGQAWTGLGVLLYGEGKSGDAVAALEHALRVDPGVKNAEIFLGLSEAGLNDCGKAVPRLNRYFASEPAGKLGRLIGLTLLECEAEAPDPLPAIQTVERLKQLYPGDEDVLYHSAELYTRLWNQNADELMTKHPDSYRVHQLAGEVYEAKNDYDQAIREYSLALARKPDLPQMHYRIGQLYLHQDSEEVDDKAMKEFLLEKSIDPDSAVTDLAMAGIEMHRHNLDKAKPLYQEAARLDPGLVESQVGLARIFLEEHDPASAGQLLQAVVAEHPDSAEAHYVLMLAYRGQKKMTEAAEQMSIFNRLQTERDESFQNKMNALLNGKSATVGATQK